MKSSIYVNSTRHTQQRRKGRYVMMQVRELKTRFGNSIAKTMVQEKKQQQTDKPEGDNTVYWMKHPDTEAEAGHKKIWAHSTRYCTSYVGIIESNVTQSDANCN